MYTASEIGYPFTDAIQYKIYASPNDINRNKPELYMFGGTNFFINDVAECAWVVGIQFNFNINIPALVVDGGSLHLIKQNRFAIVHTSTETEAVAKYKGFWERFTLSPTFRDHEKQNATRVQEQQWRAQQPAEMLVMDDLQHLEEKKRPPKCTLCRRVWHLQNPCRRYERGTSCMTMNEPIQSMCAGCSNINSIHEYWNTKLNKYDHYMPKAHLTLPGRFYSGHDYHDLGTMKLIMEKENPSRTELYRVLQSRGRPLLARLTALCRIRHEERERLQHVPRNFESKFKKLTKMLARAKELHKQMCDLMHLSEMQKSYIG
jgi:hypothetical protein